MRNIYLVRHGQSTSNAGGDAEPNAQIELTDMGNRQAHEVADWLNHRLRDNIDSINVSKFIRTHQTAQPLVNKTGLEPKVIEGLQEFDYLSFKAIEGTSLYTRRGMADDYWVMMNTMDRHGEDAESYEAFYNRVAQVLAHFKVMPSGNHVVYTHGLWISMLIWQILGQPYATNKHMRKFRQFELSIRARNGEIFCLTIADDDTANPLPPAITKVRSTAL